MTDHLPLAERLRLVATVSDLMLAGSVRVYMPPEKALKAGNDKVAVHDTRSLVA